MVPVPERLVSAVRAQIWNQIATANARSLARHWEVDEVASIIDGTDRATRSLLDLVARRALVRETITPAEAASDLGVSDRELLGIAGELVRAATKATGAELLSMIYMWPSDPDLGTRRPAFAVLWMDRAAAKLVLEVLASVEPTDRAPCPGS
jgi:hypothetical protein